MRSTLAWPDLRGRAVGVWGLGVEGRASVRKLRSLGVSPILVDDHPPTGEPDVVATLDGGLAALQACEVVVKAPGISRYRPDVVGLEAGGVAVVGGLGLWLQGADRSRVIAVTGTKGKSTTTSVLGHLLEGFGRRVLTCGNLGVPPYDPEVDDDVDWWVVEVSSYQATDVASSPPVTVVTSLHPDHLPWHDGSVERYYADKLSLCHQPGAVVTIANGDSDLVRERVELLAPRVRWVGVDAVGESGWTAELGLLGAHNHRNALLAQGALIEAGIAEAADEGALGRAAAGFVQLESRLTPVATVDGVLFVDDSLSTNVLPTLAAVEAFPGRRVALLVGGADRDIDYTSLADGLTDRAAPTLVVVLDSDSGPRIAAALDGAVDVRAGGDMTSAVAIAAAWARPDGVVLLSPAAPSFDRYRDYKAKSTDFRAAIGSAG